MSRWIPVSPHGASIPALDGFRAIAIILVILSHVGLSRIVPGQFGVTLFFFLSGYLITTLLRREFASHGRLSFKRFYLRRAVRILPPLYFAIVLAVVVAAIGVNPPVRYAYLPFDALFLSNYIPFSGLPMGLWSLAVEEHFYLVFPALVSVVLQTGKAARCAALCAVLCLVALALRIQAYDAGVSMQHIMTWSHLRIDSILFGAILACWNNPVLDPDDRLPSRWASYGLALTGLLISFVVRDEFFRQTVRMTLQGGALLLLFNAAIRDPLVSRLLDNVVFRIVATLSYSLYLVHSVVVLAADRLFPGFDTITVMAGAILVSLAISYFVYVAIEWPLGQWRRSVEARGRAHPNPTGPIKPFAANS